jgi:two-component sensor histidine kinase
MILNNIKSDSVRLELLSRDRLYFKIDEFTHSYKAVMKDREFQIEKVLRAVSDNPAQISGVKALQASVAQQNYAIINFNDKVTDKTILQEMMKYNESYSTDVINKLGVVTKEEVRLLNEHSNEVTRFKNTSMNMTLLFFILGATIIFFAVNATVNASLARHDKELLAERELRAKELEESQRKAHAYGAIMGALNKASLELIAERNIPDIIDIAVGIGCELVGAEFGVYASLGTNQGEATLNIENLHGLPRSSFPTNSTLRATKLFVSSTNEIIRSDDISEHESFGTNAPYHGMPHNHPVVRSYMAAPVFGKDDVQIGVMLFGHTEREKFAALHEDAVKSLASLASIVLENARAHSELTTEVEERKRYESELLSVSQRQRLLLQELNHRVKNTLATVQSIANQTKSSAIERLGLSGERLDNLKTFYNAFESRLLSLSGTHDLLVAGEWDHVLLEDALMVAMRPLINEDRVKFTGPKVWLSPNAAVTLNMVFHELGTNAIKYGAFVTEEGMVVTDWTVAEDNICFTWTEEGGPDIIEIPKRQGFGTKLFKRAVERELNGKAEIKYTKEGVRFYITIPVSDRIRL